MFAAVLLLYLILIYLAVFKVKSDYLLFTAFFLVFGIFGKYFLLTQYSSGLENIGAFDLNNGTMWDKAKLMLLFGSLGVTTAAAVGYYIQKAFLKKIPTPAKLNIHPKLDHFLAHPLSNLVMLGLSLLIAYVNYSFSLNFVGMKSSIDIPLLSLTWSFFINHGFVIVFTYFLFASFHKKTLTLFSTIVLMTSICLISTARLSRGFIFSCAPIFYKLIIMLKSQKKLTLVNYLKLSAVAGSLLVLILVSTNAITHMRKYKFDPFIGDESAKFQSFELPQNASEIINKAEQVPDLFTAHPTLTAKQDQSIIVKVAELFMMRFIGLEGVLASSAYVDASFEKFKKALFNNVENNISFYDKYVINSQYLSTNTSIVKFGTLPGLIGFAGISGHNGMVFLICFSIVLFCFLLELIWIKTICNQFAQVYFSAFLALGVAQFGFQPLHLFVHFFTIYVFTFALEFLLRLHHKYL